MFLSGIILELFTKASSLKQSFCLSFSSSISCYTRHIHTVALWAFKDHIGKSNFTNLDLWECVSVSNVHKSGEKGRCCCSWLTSNSPHSKGPINTWWVCCCAGPAAILHKPNKCVRLALDLLWACYRSYLAAVNEVCENPQNFLFSFLPLTNLKDTSPVNRNVTSEKSRGLAFC